jgi:creatinine amidohydrolase
MGSDPAQASPEKGGELVRLAASSLVRELNAFANEPLPG